MHSDHVFITRVHSLGEEWGWNIKHKKYEAFHLWQHSPGGGGGDGGILSS